jgi:hypothetical protein
VWEAENVSDAVDEGCLCLMPRDVVRCRPLGSEEEGIR